MLFSVYIRSSTSAGLLLSWSAKKNLQLVSLALMRETQVGIVEGQRNYPTQVCKDLGRACTVEPDAHHPLSY